MSDEQQVQEGGARVTVTIESRTRGVPAWKVRVTDEAEAELIDATVGKAVAAFRQVEAQLAAVPFVGEEPGAPR